MERATGFEPARPKPLVWKTSVQPGRTSPALVAATRVALVPSGYQPDAPLPELRGKTWCAVRESNPHLLGVGQLFLSVELPARNTWAELNYRLTVRSGTLFPLSYRCGSPIQNRTGTFGLGNRRDLHFHHRATKLGTAGRSPTCLIPIRSRMPNALDHGGSWWDRRDSNPSSLRLKGGCR